MAKRSSSKPDSENPVARTYLIAYNVAQMLGWTAIFIIIVSHVVANASNIGMFKAIEPLIKIFQTAAILEVVHSAVGLVRSGLMVTAPQIASRVFLIWGVLNSCSYVQDNVVASIFIFAWTATEVVRYAFYFFGMLGEVPYIIKWCRYSFFIVLYPLGVTGEILTMFGTLPYIDKLKINSFEMPNPINMSFNFKYVLICIMLGYTVVFPMLYNYMLVQRKKVLVDPHAKKE